MDSPNNRFGQLIYESDLKKGLLELNPNLNFDAAAAIGVEHPQMSTKQGVYIGEKHLCSMGRGPVPEYNVWWVKKLKGTSIKVRSHIQSPGWRHTFYELVKHRVPGINWATLCAKFNVPYKSPVAGEPTSTMADNHKSAIIEGVML